jgi:hypothetical protein
MAELPVFGGESEKLLLAVAREIAMDLYPVETILKTYQIEPKTFENYLKLPRFQTMLEESRIAWNAATNVAERIKLKQLAVVEEAIPEMWKVLHDHGQPLSARVELYKTLMKGAGVGVADGVIDTAGKVSITINMGAAAEPVVVQTTLPGSVIDGEVLDA